MQIAYILIRMTGLSKNSRKQFFVGINLVENEKTQLLFRTLNFGNWSLALIWFRIALPPNRNKLYCLCLFLESGKTLVFENIIYFDAQAGKRNIKFKHVLGENMFVCSTVQERV